jgi:hypothetical protein
MPVMPLQRLPTPPPCDPAVSAPRAEMPKRGRAAAAAPRGPAAAARRPPAAAPRRPAAAAPRQQDDAPRPPAAAAAAAQAHDPVTMIPPFTFQRVAGQNYDPAVMDAGKGDRNSSTRSCTAQALNKMVRFQRQLFGRELRQRQRHHAAQGARRAAAREQGNGRRGRRVERLRRPRRARRMRRPVLNSKVIFTRMSKSRFL